MLLKLEPTVPVKSKPEITAPQYPSWHESPAWLTKRIEMLIIRGPRCELCQRADWQKATFQVDHIIPVSVNPSRWLDNDNLQILCEDCNRAKSNRFVADFRGSREVFFEEFEIKKRIAAIRTAMKRRMAHTKSKEEQFYLNSLFCSMEQRVKQNEFDIHKTAAIVASVLFDWIIADSFPWIGEIQISGVDN